MPSDQPDRHDANQQPPELPDESTGGWFDWCSDGAVSMLGSMLVHLVVLLLLACVVLGQEKRTRHVSLMVSLHDSDGFGAPDHLSLFEIAPPGDSPDVGESAPLGPVDDMQTEQALAQGLTTLVTNVQSPLDGSFAASLTPQSLGSGSGGGGTGGGAGGLGKLRGASFMGASAKGNRFVFVVDSSRSMFGPRWQFACDKLIESLSRLEDGQEYYVMCFDAETKFMFNASPGRKARFQQADSTSVRRVKRWLAGIQLGRATMPAEALCFALEMEPDAIFLLSDGELQDNTLRVLGVVNGKSSDTKTPIHTIHLFSEQGRETLRQIAAENNGSFTPISPPPGVPLF